MKDNNLISAVILTKNDERTIKRCLESLSWCHEIIVVDDYSSDNTLSLVRDFNKDIRIYKRHIGGDFSSQRNYALEKINTKWVLFVDSDEEIPDELAKEITQNLKNTINSGIQGYYIMRKDTFAGKLLEHGETGNISFIRLAKKDAGKWYGKVHEVWNIPGKKITLKHNIYHFPHPSVSLFLDEINRYTDIEAYARFKEGRRDGFKEILFFPLGKFLCNYLIKLGFLDGVPGLLVAVMMSFHSFLVRAKLFRLVQNKNER
ncbi:MAG: glycosyltransferase family 2 protein [Patescibacteria group bacterium]|nr:glycosyltransferase family 2 protein [Patescibacteria group bacterium]